MLRRHCRCMRGSTCPTAPWYCSHEHRTSSRPLLPSRPALPSSRTSPPSTSRRHAPCDHCPRGPRHSLLALALKRQRLLAHSTPSPTLSSFNLVGRGLRRVPWLRQCRRSSYKCGAASSAESHCIRRRWHQAAMRIRHHNRGCHTRVTLPQLCPVWHALWRPCLLTAARAYFLLCAACSIIPAIDSALKLPVFASIMWVVLSIPLIILPEPPTHPDAARLCYRLARCFAPGRAPGACNRVIQSRRCGRCARDPPQHCITRRCRIAR